ncbi:MAG TPA: rhodanese-like domain-containing protein [Gammaproteobacteria bacterium]|nr:rhodanese-like domain-containing protein [Gammaproteobacteria bacterium]
MDINQLIEFTGNHPMLVAAFAAILAMLIGGELRQRLSGVNAVGPGEATRMLNHDNAVIVDMREDKDYREGHIVSAVHTPASNSDAVQKLEKFRDRPVIVYCRSGQTSAGFCRKLHKQGFPSVYNLAGGVLGWQKAGLPLSKNS